MRFCTLLIGPNKSVLCLWAEPTKTTNRIIRQKCQTCLVGGDRRWQIVPFWDKTLRIMIHSWKILLDDLDRFLHFLGIFLRIAEVVVEIRQVAAGPDPVAEHDTFISSGLVGTLSFEHTDRHHDGRRVGVVSGDLLVRRHRRAVLQRIVRVGLGQPRGVRLAPRTAVATGAPLLRQDLVALVAHPRRLVQVLQSILEAATFRAEDVTARATVVSSLDHGELHVAMETAGGVAVGDPNRGLLAQP